MIMIQQTLAYYCAHDSDNARARLRKFYFFTNSNRSHIFLHVKCTVHVYIVFPSHSFGRVLLVFYYFSLTPRAS